MSELAATTIVGIGGFLVGLVFGAVAQRTNFCTMGGISDLVLMGDGRRMRAWVLATAVAIIGTQSLHFAAIIDVNASIYLTPNLGWLGAILGGAMFGFGMTQAGGCGSRTLVRLGGGNLKSLVVAIILGIVAYMTLRGMLALARVQIENVANIDLKARGLSSQSIGDLAGMLTGLPAATTRAGAAAALALALLVFCFKDRAFRSSVRDMTAGVVVGLATVAGWIVTGVLAADEFDPVPLASVTFVAPVGESLQYLMTFTGATINFGIAVVAGVVAGSFLAAVASKTFRIEAFADRADLVRHFGGAALMGAGGVLALGCTIGQGVTGVSTLSLGSLIAWLSILAGGYLGVKVLEEGSFGSALRAAFARG
ncbi:MAG: YeeE/YedE family protein [Bradyrhizobiaceae bacterium]|nr:MAG: YeeE/YedE family protein [Bradyrhizobiaceae bacterium]